MPLNYVLFVIVTLALTAFISYGTYATARLLKHWRPEQNILLNPVENLVRLIILLLCIGLGLLSGLGPIALGWRVDQPLIQLLIGIIIGLSLGLIFYYTTRWIMSRTGQRIYSTVVIEHIAPTNQREFYLVLLAMIPVVLLEELLFRSLLLGGLTPIVPIPILLIGLSLLFGLLHSPQGIWGMAGAGLAGLIFGLLFLWQGSLLTPFIAHYITNAFQISRAKQQKHAL